MRTVGARSLALANGEILKAGLLGGDHFDRGDARGRRALLFKIVEKQLERRLGAFQMNVHALRLVQHPSGERAPSRQAKHKRTEVHALHHAAYSNVARDGHDEPP